ncbi:MAG TPA: DNA polymerase domain-containing protein, partial [Candidatus Thermoplasmatota archaeon]|nr:DNA polymerase domain-containing protein [Candidatus Thermoplasmatota archaeon]
RYYGCFDTVPDKPSRSNASQDPDHLAGGRLKVRGVELRQSSACGVVVRTQERFLSAMAAARDADDFRARLPEGLAAARAVVAEVARGDAPFDDLVITLHVSRELEDYRQRNDAHAALKQLAKRGVRVPAGDAVRFVLLDAGNPDPVRRLVEARLATGREAYDRDAYVRLALRGLESLTLPLGYDAAALKALFQGRVQTRLVLPRTA